MCNYVKRHPKVRLITKRRANDHGPCLTQMTLRATEDLVMFIEDDAVIFRPNMVTECFDRIEKGYADIVASGRGSSADSLIQAAKEKYGLNYEGYGDKGPHFWPNFFFARRNDLLKTDMNFAAKVWQRGEFIKELDLTVPEEQAAGDTFVWASIQLRAMGLKIYNVPQYHAHPNDFEEKESNQNLWDGNCPWLHLGSVSSGIFGILRDDYGKPLAHRTNPDLKGEEKLPDYIHSEGDKNEFERRVMWWQLAYEETRGECKDIEYFGEMYWKATENIINQYQLSNDKINKRKKIYKELMGI